eukprot:3490212-Pyramimonas_sp.AAC.1
MAYQGLNGHVPPLLAACYLRVCRRGGGAPEGGGKDVEELDGEALLTLAIHDWPLVAPRPPLRVESLVRHLWGDGALHMCNAPTRRSVTHV